MAVNKNFVVKHGLEVNSDLILADSTNKRVGIGSTIPDYTLDVIGGIGATDIYISGLSTFVGFSTFQDSIGVQKDITIAGISTVVGVATFRNNVFIDGDLKVVGDVTYDEVNGRNIYISGLSTFVGFSTFKSDVFVAGVTTFVGVSTFHNDVHIGGNLNVTGDIVYDEVTGRNIYISGLSTFVGVSTFSTGLFTKDLYVTGVSTFDGAIDANAAINVADSTALTFGADDDLEIYHTAGSNSFIKSNTLDLQVLSDSSKFISKNGTDLFATFNSSGVGVGTTNPGIAADSNNTKVVNTGIVTANYLYGDGSGLTNITAVGGGTIGIQSGTTYIGSGLTTLGVTGGSATVTPVSSGIATITLPAAGVSLGLAIALGG